MRSWFRENADYLWRQSQLAAAHAERPLLNAGEGRQTKYDPDQPRVPAGNSDGGQWTSEDGRFLDAGSGTLTFSANARISQAREAACDMMRRQDEFQCRMVGLRACWAQAALRYSNCIYGRPIPPLNYEGEGMIIAQRLLKLRTPDRDIEIPFRIYAPEYDKGTWWCRYEADWPDEKHSSRAGGIDAIQALVGALQMLGADVYASNYHKSGKLFLDAPGKGYGFPVVPSLRDLLVGDDKRFL